MFISGFGGGSRRLTLMTVVFLLLVGVAPSHAAESKDHDQATPGVMPPGGEIFDVPSALASPPPTAPSPQRVLDEPLQGQAAIDALGDKLDLVAAQNGLTTVEMVALLADPTVWVDVTGHIFFVENPLDLVILGPVPTSPLPGPFPYEETFLLHSNPGSQRTIYLDFDGHTVTGTGWNVIFAVDPIIALPYDSDGNPSSFTNTELDAIQSIWQRVAEDYAPFDVDVTTQDPGYAAINRSSTGDATYGTRLVVTSSSGDVCPGSSGCAFLGNFDRIGADHDFFQPGWTFPVPPWNTNAKIIAEVISSEVGHNVGLSHDGQGSTVYYTGHDVWAAIMGSSFTRPIVQFSKGEYSNPSNTEDDFVVMASNGLAGRADDHANNTGTATDLTSSQTGIISSENDIDVFRYSPAVSGLASFSAQPSPVSPNLDIVLALFSSDMTLLQVSAPPVAFVSQDVASGMDAEITYSVTTGKTYFVQVSGGSHGPDGNTGYTRYGSIGQFTISVTVNPKANTFVDDDGHLFENAIEWLAAEGITKGCNPPVNDKFCPNDNVTRGEMAVFLVRAMGYSDNGGGNLFVDDDGFFYENAADRLFTAGVTQGCNPPVNNKYCGEAKVTRGQMAAFLVRAMGYTDNGGGNLFIDDDGHLFENAIDKLGAAKVTLGCNPPVNDKFCPNDFVTRGQMAAFLKRALT